MQSSRISSLPGAAAQGRLQPQESRQDPSLRESLRGYMAANLLLAMGIFVGFIHGWLKLRIRHPATTFAFDVFLILALVLVFLKQGSLRRFMPPGPIGRALLFLYALCLIYFPFALFPGLPPPLLALVAIRSWCFGTLMYCVGYHIIQSPTQLRAYLLLVVILAFGTSLYGLRQSPEEIKALLESDPYYAARFINQTYVNSKGSGVRIFSTFVSSAGYGGTLAIAMIFALILASEAATRPFLRFLLYGMMVSLAYGIVQSGSRSSLGFAALGCAAVMVLRRQWMALLLVPAILAGALLLANKETGGVIAERFSSLRELDAVALRFLIPALIGADYILEGHPLGGGLGKSGFMPMFLARRVEYRDFVGADGDLGKLFIEMGLPGSIVFFWLLFAAGKLSWTHVRLYAKSPIGGLVLAAAITFFISVINFPIGSPYIGIPLGMLVWFFVGASHKLVVLAEQQEITAQAPAQVGVAPSRVGIYGQLVPAPASRQRTRPLVPTDAGQAAALLAARPAPRPESQSHAAPESAPAGRPGSKPAKIPFLYYRGDAR